MRKKNTHQHPEMRRSAEQELTFNYWNKLMIDCASLIWSWMRSLSAWPETSRNFAFSLATETLSPGTLWNTRTYLSPVVSIKREVESKRMHRIGATRPRIKQKTAIIYAWAKLKMDKRIYRYERLLSRIRIRHSRRNRQKWKNPCQLQPH